jgi:hypothetical protein
MRPKTRSRHNRAADNYFAKTGAIIVFGNVKIGSLFQAGSEAGVWYDGIGWRLRFLVAQTEQLRVTFRCAKPKTFAGQSPLPKRAPTKLGIPTRGAARSLPA